MVFGQLEFYLEGCGNIGFNGDGLLYIVILWLIIYQDLNVVYGDGVIIMCIDGVGVGCNFLDLSEEMYVGMEEVFVDGEFYQENLVYVLGVGLI